jgi:putative hemolysin
MVTLADLLEAIIGDLPGANHDGDDDAVQRADGSWLMDGLISLDRVQTLLHSQSLESEEYDYNSLGGLVMHQLGRVPSVGDLFDFRGLRFEVVDMDGSRVDRLLVLTIEDEG